MSLVKNRYRLLALSVAVVISTIVLLFHIISHNETEKVYVSQIEDVALQLKKDFLRDTVNNMIHQIDRLRISKTEIYQLNTDKRRDRLFVLADALDEESFMRLFESEFEQTGEDNLWTAYVYHRDTGELIFATENIKEQGVSVESLDSILATKALLKKGTYTGVFGVADQYIDAIVQADIKEIIHHQTYKNDAYIWVNEVIDFAGGDDYAIRRIHPNLIETEGKLLSTSMTDAVGGTPYLTELNGINDAGELFFTYYFKKLQSEDVSKKITFAKLYEPYNWIVAKGVHLDDLDGYVSEVREESQRLLAQTVLYILLYLLSALILGFMLIYIIMERNLRKSTRRLIDEASTDPLTGAESRRYGERILEHKYETYHVKKNPVYMAMLDIDDFKLINDRYGHDAGDRVLKYVTETIQSILEEKGKVIRWGGDEFVVVMEAITKNEAMLLLDQVLYACETKPLDLASDKLTISLSIGMAQILDKDSNYIEALKRADKAMYQSKEEGKCRLTFIE